jgi:hypothetical protein
MSTLILGLLIMGLVVYLMFGALLAALDMENKEVYLPRDFYNDGYNWFGSWVIFIFRTLLVLPFWILFTLLNIIGSFFSWLFTVRR